MLDEQITCRKCNKTFDFYPENKGLQSNFVCMECKKVKDRKVNSGYHGLSSKQYSDLLIKQKGCCAICKKKSKQKLVVDHCHEQGYIRGLLCRNCNAGLGQFLDNPLILEAAIGYLQEDHTSKPIHLKFAEQKLQQLLRKD